MALNLCYTVQTRAKPSDRWCTIAKFVNEGDAVFFAGPRSTLHGEYSRIKFAGKVTMSWSPPAPPVKP